MFSIQGNDITLTRGDTLLLNIHIYKNKEEYIPDEQDVIRFAMKRKYSDPDDQAIIVKEIPNDTLLLEILPEETKTLPMRSKYVYDIQLTTAEGRVDTFIRGTLQLDKEVL